MTLAAHGDQKYRISRRLSDAAEWSGVRVEHRRLEAGVQAELTLQCTEIVLMLSGRSGVRRTSDGQTQEALAQRGMDWVCPVGTHESNIELTAPIEGPRLFLPPSLIEPSALADYDIDPAKTELAYAGRFLDPMLLQIGSAFRGLLGRGMRPTDQLFVDGMQTALAAHLLRNYALDRWQPPTWAPVLSPKRLQRVLDFIEAPLASDITLEGLAAEACLSPFHFSRLFREATGLLPHRYVTDHPIQAAKDKLTLSHTSLVEVAIGTAFSSQANFIRVFRKPTGLTPGQYRSLQAR